jgi:hypothetical protein
VDAHRKSGLDRADGCGPVGCGCVPDPDAPLDTDPLSGPTGQAGNGGSCEA